MCLLVFGSSKFLHAFCATVDEFTMTGLSVFSQVISGVESSLAPVRSAWPCVEMFSVPRKAFRNILLVNVGHHVVVPVLAEGQL